jgi:hypothetical protein
MFDVSWSGCRNSAITANFLPEHLGQVWVDRIRHN